MTRLAGVIASCAALIAAACASTPVVAPVPEIAPGYLAGYLSAEQLPGSLSLLPPAPAPTSATVARDEEASKTALALQGSPRWDLAARDVELSFPKAAETFSCALGVEVSEAQTPRLYLLLRRTLTDAGRSTSPTKKAFMRQRPFMVNGQPTCAPKDEAFLRNDGSYPSGHSAIGWAWGLLLAQAAPERADAVLARGRAFGHSRVVCNVHWLSDVEEGRVMGAAAVARLQSAPDFQADMAAARAEIIAARAAGKTPQGDCAGEAALLAGQP